MHNRRRGALALLILALALAGCTAYGPGSADRTISVTGEGTVVVPPDTVVLTLGVQTRGTEVGPTVAENNRAAERVIQAVTALGVAAEDVQTSYFSISTQPRYDQFGNVTDEVTYWVDNSITVTLHDIQQLGELLNQALAQGANSVQGISFTVSDRSAALVPARSQALDDARRQAEQIAGAAGVALGEIVSLNENTSGPNPGPRPYTGAEAPATSGVPTTPGSLELSVYLSVVYEIR
jgi:hypothetical protein